MMKLQLLQHFKDHGLTHVISYKTKPMARKKPEEKQDSLNLETNTQKGKANIKTFLRYIPIFKNGSVGKLFTNLCKLINNFFSFEVAWLDNVTNDLLFPE